MITTLTRQLTFEQTSNLILNLFQGILLQNKRNSKGVTTPQPTSTAHYSFAPYLQQANLTQVVLECEVYRSMAPPFASKMKINTLTEEEFIYKFKKKDYMF